MNHDGKTDRTASPQVGGAPLSIREESRTGSQSGGRYPAGTVRGAEIAGADHRSNGDKPRYGQDPAGRLTRQITGLLPAASLRLCLSESTSWASATFCGARHLILFERTDGQSFSKAERHIITGLGDHEFTASRHLVADLAAQILDDGQGERLRIEALTVEVG